MPQFDPSTFASQIFWLIVVFGGLYWLMLKKALPKMEAVLNARAERIQGDLDRAAKLQADAVAATEAYEAAIAKARDEARAAMRDAQAETQAALDARQAAIAKELGEQAAAAETRIAAARDEAMASVREIAVDAAEAVASRLVGAPVGTDAAASAVDAVLTQRGH